MQFNEIDTGISDELNSRLYERFVELSSSDRIRQTHHFAGRFENTYVDEADIPDMAVILAVVKQQAAQFLDTKSDKLRAGFWFNAMGPGHITAPHHHDENDELLSAVYYIRVPEDSGALILHEAGQETTVQPEEGKLVLFAPSVMHQVTRNNSAEMRLSVAINIGPEDDS